MKKSEKKSISEKVRKNFNDSLSYIKESANFVYVIIGLFLVSALFGFFFSSYLGFIDSILQNIIDSTKDITGIRLTLFIFNNNVFASFYGLFLGVLFGLMSIVNSIVNGMVLGYVFSKVYLISGFSDFWRILPHGIFELPAIFISLGLGLRLGMFIFAKKKKEEFVYRFKESFKAFIFVVVPLLVLAAIIEGALITLLS